MLTRRAAMYSAAAAVLVLATPRLRRRRSETAPAEGRTRRAALRARARTGHKQGPKIMEFKLVIEEKKVVIDDAGHAPSTP